MGTDPLAWINQRRQAEEYRRNVGKTAHYIGSMKKQPGRPTDNFTRATFIVREDLLKA